MSGTGSLFKRSAQQMPLAERLRPASLDDIVGQEHLLGEGGMLRAFLSAPILPSLILWGPPGCGKTTLAKLIAAHVNHHFISVSAVFTGTAELKSLFEQAEARLNVGQKTLLFVDEIHRFNRAQQDTFLAHLEDGRITLVGATTENPSFELNGALLSRTHVLTLHALSKEALTALMARASEATGRALNLEDEARDLLLHMADGDGRALLSLIESIHSAQKEGAPPMSTSTLLRHLPKRASLYDKGRDGHYNLVSALHKAVRGSDVNASLYWFARMLEGGEDPRYLGRRFVRMASEDIGLADPGALTQAIAGLEAYERLGSPEGELALAQVLIYLATAPKSNAAYVALGRARECAKQNGSLSPPAFSLNAPTSLMKEQGYGVGYIYDHNTPEGCAGQNYFPDKMPRQGFYDPSDRGFERELRKRLDYWRTLREGN